MKNENVLDPAQRVKVAQYKGTSWVSRAIKFATRGKYSHTAIILPDGRIVEAWQGVNMVRVISSLSEGHTPGTLVDIYSTNFTESEQTKFIEFIEEQVGKPYSKWGLVASYFNKSEYNKYEGKRWFCSQVFVAACHAASRFYWGTDTKPWQIPPTMVTRNCNFTKIETKVTV